MTTELNEGFLLESRTLLQNAKADPEILSRLTGFGYDSAKIDSGMLLLTEAEAHILKQKKEYGEQFQATQDLMAAWDTADKVYKKTLKVARVAFRNNAKAAAALSLLGGRNESVTGWLEQANAFYANLLSDTGWISEMANYGYTPDRLNAELALVGEVSKAARVQSKEKGEAQQATQLRDEKVKALDRWISDFRSIAKVALSDTPQKMESLGVTVLNGRRVKKTRPEPVAK